MEAKRMDCPEHLRRPFCNQKGIRLWRCPNCEVNDILIWLRDGNLYDASQQFHTGDYRIKAAEVAKTLAEVVPPEVRVEFADYNDMLFLFEIGAANWDLWAGSMMFQNIVHYYGTEADKFRLTKMGLGYRYRPASSRLNLTVEDREFLRICGIDGEPERQSRLSF